MADAFKQSRLGKTNPSPYDQVILLSQKMINAALKNMWLLADKDSPLKKFKKSTRDGSIDVTLNAPTVELHATSNDPQLYFFLHIKGSRTNKGKSEDDTITVYTSEDSDDDSTKTFVPKDWAIASAVKIARKYIDSSDLLFTQAVADKGLPSSSFSLAQLYLDISSSKVSSPTHNTYGSIDWDKETAQTQTGMENFVKSWLTLMSKKNCTILGYALQAKNTDDANTHAPNFPPTSIDYAVYPWKDPTVYPEPKAVNKRDENALCYLMMSKMQDAPATADLPYSGTFVNVGGTYIMSRDIFWDKWLIPALQAVNRGAELIPLSPVTEYDSTKTEYPYTIDAKFECGVDGNHAGSDDKYYQFTASSSNSNEWTWEGDKKVTSSSVDGWNNGVKVTLKVTQTSTSSTNVSFSKEGQTAALKGENRFIIDVVYTANNGTTDYGYSKFDITTTWHFNMALSSVHDGGVQFARVADATGTKPCKSNCIPTDGGALWKDGYDAITKDLTKDLGDYLSNDTVEIENKLLGSLEHQHKLFLPAGGVFLMKDPVFNARGDLLVSLDYNGTDPPETPKAAATTTTTTNKAAANTLADSTAALSLKALPVRAKPRPIPSLAIRRGGLTQVSAHA